jgi:hypothetical protein
MKPPRYRRWASALAGAICLLLPVLQARPARADASLKCTMDFTMKGWSAFYQSATGHGLIHCSNGRSMRVRLEAKGGGVTVGKSVESGHGVFSNVPNIRDTLGTYARAEAQAGALKSAQGEVLTKGEVSLALSGKGRGWELGVSFGEFTIRR